MFIFYLTIYVLIGCIVAFYIHKDGEFRPIDTTSYMIASVFIWLFILPVWLLIRPPSQLKDLGFEQSHAHYKQWKKTHKMRDLGDISFYDKKNEENGEEDEYSGDVTGKTAPDNPYVIGKKTKVSTSNNFFPDNLGDDYGWDTDLDRAPTYEIGGNSPRKVYNPFDAEKKPAFRSDAQETELDSNETSTREKSSKPSVPSIEDILDKSHMKSPKPSTEGGPFRDTNVRKLIDDGRLRDAYRVAKRMLKLARELGEEDRSTAYRRYLREIENRIKADQEQKGL